jgi:DNA-binding transcriptional LysR family regulator
MIDIAGQRLRFTLRQLEVFAATAQAGSTRGGAERVARSQSATSAALADLESALGAPLFDRIGRRLALNEQGRALLPPAVALLQQAGELQAQFSPGQASPLRMAASLTIGEYLLPARIAAWHLQHPDQPVQLAIGNTRAVIDAVVGLQADVGFVEGRQGHPELRWRDWLGDELLVVAAPGSRWTRRAQSPAQLAQAPWILRELGSGTREVADHWLQSHVGELRPAFELGSTEAVKQLAAAGAGLALVSRHALQLDLKHRRLVAVRTGLQPATRQLSIVMRRDRPPGRAAQAFVAQCLAGG